MSQAELARRLGVSPQAISDWLRGDSLPKADMMARLEDLLGIPMRSWTESALVDIDEKRTGTSG